MDDKKIILSHGGPRKLAALLGFGKGGHQRVHNWMARGIPLKQKLERPDLFPYRPKKHSKSRTK